MTPKVECLTQGKPEALRIANCTAGLSFKRSGLVANGGELDRFCPAGRISFPASPWIRSRAAYSGPRLTPAR